MARSAKKDASIESLRKTLDSLKEIRSALLPFLQLLKDDDGRGNTLPRSGKKRSRPNGLADAIVDGAQFPGGTPKKLTPHKRAEAEAAVALAVGTLRYMGARLRGLDRGRRKGDPLRVELDKIRGMLVGLRKLERAKENGESDAGAKGNGKVPSAKKDGNDEKATVDVGQKRKAVDANRDGNNLGSNKKRRK